jgi:hypothetical protein
LVRQIDFVLVLFVKQFEIVYAVQSLECENLAQALSDGMSDLRKKVNDLEADNRAISAKVDTLSAKLSERNKTSNRKKK